MHLYDLQALAAIYAIRLESDEFGDDLLITCNPEHIRWAKVSRLRDPVPLMRCSSRSALMSKSKLELMLALRTDNWKPSTERHLAPYIMGEAKMFTQSCAKPVSYLAALLLASDVFAKVQQHC